MSNEEYLKELGLRVRAARKAKKVSLSQMAARINMTMNSVKYIESGTRNTHILTLKAMADALKIDVKEFL